ncbi:MAG: type II secretion system protein [Gallionella sp.]|jgi:prepilin-type N-terminal cleavage/methylation domain-containing protein
MWKQNRQSGFTLVELAIVLVIIGLILAAVLKGQEMIQNARVKSVINDLRGVSSAFYAYQDRYKAIPGDDANAANHFTGGVNGGGNGTIVGLYTATGTVLADGNTAESEKFWQHTRLAGFMTGSGSNPPTNALGGLLGIQSDITATGGTTYGMIGPVVCAGSIPWKIALAVDTVLDDGNSATGTVRAGATGAANLDTTNATAAAFGSGVAAPATMDQLHTVCMRI